MQLKLGRQEELIEQTAKILSDITNYTSIVLKPELSKVLIKKVQIMPIDGEFVLLIVVTNSGIIRDTIVRFPEGVEPSYLKKFQICLQSVSETRVFRDKFPSNT